jgi:hypothetical protein
VTVLAEKAISSNVNVGHLSMLEARDDQIGSTCVAVLRVGLAPAARWGTYPSMLGTQSID